MDLDVKMTGFGAIKKRMDALDKKLATKTGKKAVRKAGLVIKREAVLQSRKQHTKYSTGLLRKSISSKVMKSHELLDRGTVGQKIGVKKDAFYWRFLEFGTVKMAAKPFLRPAYENKKDEALSTIIETLREDI